MSRVLFNGKLLREPGSATQLRVGVQPAVNPNATNRVAVIGESDGGVLGTCQTFSNYYEAVQVLRGGKSLKAIASIFNPSPSFGGAAQVDFIRAQAATVAAKSFSDSASKVGFTVTSVDKGSWVNGISVSIVAGSQNASARIVTLKVPSPAIQSGTDGVATVSGKVFESATAKFISRGARVGDSILVRNSAATTVVVYTIESVVSETKVTLVETPTAGSSLIWEHIVYGRTHVSPELTVFSDATKANQSLVSWINSVAGDVVTATNGVSDAGLVAAASSPLVGGTVTAMTTTDISAALLILRTKQVNHLFVAAACGSDTSAGELNFAGLLRGHLLNDAETPGMAYVGSAADKTVDDAIAYSGTLNSGRVVYCFQTAIDAALDGLGTEEIPGWMLAAKVAGLAAGVTPEVPLTRKALAVLGLKDLPSNAQLDKATRERLLAAGVLHIYRPAGGNAFVINQGVTTLQSNDNLWDAATASSSEISLVRIADTIMNDLKVSAAATFVGSTAGFAKPVIEHFVTSYLESQVGTLLLGYKNVVITRDQDKYYIQVGLLPNYPVNFLLISGTIIG